MNWFSEELAVVREVEVPFKIVLNLSRFRSGATSWLDMLAVKLGDM